MSRRDEFRLQQVKLLGVSVVPVAGVITIALLVFNLYEWLSNDRGSLLPAGGQ